MIPDISELPMWALLAITLASACAGFIPVALIVRNKNEKKKKRIKIEREVEKIMQGVTFAQQKFEKLLNDYPGYYFIPEKLKELNELNNQIQACSIKNIDELHRLVKIHTEVLTTSFKSSSKSDHELMQTLNEYFLAVCAMLKNKNVARNDKLSNTLKLVRYLQALDVKLPSILKRQLPVDVYIGTDPIVRHR